MSEDRALLVQQVRKWGDINSDSILDPICTIFRDAQIEGLIAYRVEAGKAVVYGDPVCAEEDKLGLASTFQKHCENKKLGVIYVCVSESFAKLAINGLCRVMIGYGERLIFDPRVNPLEQTGRKAIVVRNKVRVAEKERVEVSEYVDEDPQLESEMEAVTKKWLKARRGFQVYSAHVKLFGDRLGKRWLYAHQGKKVIGVLMLNELQACGGWQLNNLMIVPEAPYGTQEMLVVTAFRKLAEEGCYVVVSGPAPAKQLTEIVGMSGFNAWVTRGIYSFVRRKFKLDHLMFWKKFYPKREMSYLLFSDRRISVRTVLALAKAFNVVK
ncbi:MAG: DUF2156 domain-containing protein [Parachlamydiaceae bacterium]|nr:DUF2156 domain-containing protein [Parachlamydiaceae bacterium]